MNFLTLISKFLIKKKGKENTTMFTQRRSQPKTAQQSASAGSITGYMAELDKWLDENVYEPIERAIESGDTKELHLAFTESKLQIKRKVLASYHNGLKAKTPTNQKTMDNKLIAEIKSRGIPALYTQENVPDAH